MVNYILNSSEQNQIIGTWHPNGYHGHFRSKSRSEFSNLYRQFAKPKPPQKFSVRLDDDATKHTFSKHDNRQIFLNDPTVFGSGLGKKKIDSINKSKWNPELIAWREKTATDLARKESIYQHDFCSNYSGTKLLSARKNLEVKPISVYEYAFSHGEPRPETSKTVRLETNHRYVNKSRAKSNTPSERLSVANCLVWQNSIPIKLTQSNLNNENTNSMISNYESQPIILERPKTVAVCTEK